MADFSRAMSRRGALKVAGAGAGALAMRQFTLPQQALAQEAAPGVLRWATDDEWAGKEVLDPASPDRLWESLGALYNRLVKPDNDGLPVPDLALEWSPDAGAERWTFTLRPDVTFHDGRRFTAKDVVATVAHVLDPDLQSPSAAVLEIIDVDGFETPDDQTVIFSLKQPHADFPMLMLHYSMYIIPEGSSAEEIGTLGIGTGPFRLESFNPGSTTRLVANENYWEGVPGLKGIELIPIADVEARISALMAGQVDFIDGFSGSSVAVLEANPNVMLQELPSGNWTTLVMRCDQAPFDNADVRQAMKLVVDRPFAVQAVLQGHGVPANDHPVWPGDPYALAEERPQDLEAARELLAGAGFPDGLTVELFTSDIQGPMASLAVVYKEMAAAAGINVDVKQTPADGYWNDIWMNKPFCTSSWGERPADQVLNEVFRAGATWNESFWEDAEFEQLLDDARREIDADVRRGLYQEAQQRLMNGSGNIIPFFTTDLRALSSRVQNFADTQRDLNYFTVSVE